MCEFWWRDGGCGYFVCHHGRKRLIGLMMRRAIRESHRGGIRGEQCWRKVGAGLNVGRGMGRGSEQSMTKIGEWGATRLSTAKIVNNVLALPAHWKAMKAHK